MFSFILHVITVYLAFWLDEVHEASLIIILFAVIECYNPSNKLLNLFVYRYMMLYNLEKANGLTKTLDLQLKHI